MSYRAHAGFLAPNPLLEIQEKQRKYQQHVSALKDCRPLTDTSIPPQCNRINNLNNRSAYINHCLWKASIENERSIKKVHSNSSRVINNGKAAPKISRPVTSSRRIDWLKKVPQQSASTSMEQPRKELHKSFTD